jgi:hypothetical protein
MDQRRLLRATTRNQMTPTNERAHHTTEN